MLHEAGKSVFTLVSGFLYALMADGIRAKEKRKQINMYCGGENTCQRGEGENQHVLRRGEYVSKRQMIKTTRTEAEKVRVKEKRKQNNTYRGVESTCQRGQAKQHIIRRGAG